MNVSLIHDTGTGLSIIGGTYFDDYLRESLKLLPTTMTASAANGQRMTVRGKCKAWVAIGGRIAEIDFNVIEELGMEIILGTAAMKQFKMVLDFDANKIRFHDGKETAEMDCEREQEKGQEAKVVAAKRITIPARHVRRIEVEIEQQTAEGIKEIYTPLYIFAERHCYIRGGIIDNRRKGTVEMMNITNYPIVIEEGMTVGVAITSSGVRLIEQDLKGKTSTNGDYMDVIQQIEELNLAKDSNLTASQQNKLKQILRQYVHVFAPNPKAPKRTPKVKHSINTGNAAPIKQRPYRLSPAENQRANKEIQEMLKNKVIRKSNSPWASPIVLVKKPDGSIRFCVDYRKLNDVTKKDVYPLPRIDDTLDKMRGMQYFTSMDLASGYWQIEINESDKEKTAFTCAMGLFEFNVMPFGLCNAPATFQRLMDEVIADMDWRVGSDYIDDLIIGSLTFEEHCGDLIKVLERLSLYGLTVKLSKCHFFKQKLIYLGHEISNEGIRPNPAKTAAVEKMLPPTNLQSLRRFLGMTNYYRRFIHKYAEIADPLTRLLRKDALYKWNSDCQQAFDTLKQKLKSPPILRYPDFSKPFILHTDASIIGLGVVLCQEQDDKEVVIAYASRAVTKEERKWGITELECLAVMWGLKIFRHYIYGRTVTVWTDHSALTSLKTKRDELTGRLGRWALKLQEYDMNIKHRPGKTHCDADALSRMDTEGRIYNVNWYEKPILEIRASKDKCKRHPLEKYQRLGKDHTIYYVKGKKRKQQWTEDKISMEDQQMIRAQQEDEELGGIYDYLMNRRLPQDERNQRKVIMEAAGYEINNNILYRTVPTPRMVQRKDVVFRLAVPRIYIPKILKQCHNAITAGHLGVKKTYERISQQYYWRGMLNDVKEWIRTCMECAMKKGLPNTKLGYMGTVEATYPWEVVGTDIIGPIPQTNGGKKYILVFTDHYTKYAEAFAVEKQDAETIAHFYVKEIICRYGAPTKLLSDRGKAFIGEVLTRVCKRLGIEKLKTSSMHPQTNGHTERFNKTLIAIIAMFVSEHQKDWDELIPYALYAYNTSVHPTTNETPFYLMFARVPKTIEDLLPDAITSERIPIESRKKFIEEQFSAIKDEVRSFADTVKQKRLDKSDEDRVDHDFNEGDIVWLYNRQVKKEQVKKLAMAWHGPYRIKKFIGPVTVILQNQARRTIRQPVHVSRLKHYVSPQLPVDPQIEEDDTAIGEETKEEHSEQIAKEKRGKNNDNADKMLEEEEYEVERIMNHRIKKGKIQFQLRWKGYTPLNDTWTDLTEMQNCQQLIDEYRLRSMNETEATYLGKRQNKKRNSMDELNKLLEQTVIQQDSSEKEQRESKDRKCEECGFIAKNRRGLKTHSRCHI